MTTHSGWISMTAAEVLKLRRTLMLSLALLSPLAPPGLSVLIGLMAEQAPPPGANVWALLAAPAADVWSLMMLPMLSALQPALLSNLESSNAQWKHLFALPLSRARLYIVKSLILLTLMTLSSIVLFVGMLAAGVAVGMLRQDTGLFQTAPDLPAIAGTAARPYIASLMLLGIHQWISHRWTSIVVAIGTAIVGLTIALVVLQSDRWGAYFPWGLPMRALRGPEAERTFILLYPAVGWLVLLMLGAWDMRRRETA